jgi:beta-glucanase (GH16 family)
MQNTLQLFPIKQWLTVIFTACRFSIIGLLFTLTSIPATAGWEVQWIDTFEGNGVNWENWTAQTQANYNNEVQCYTDDDFSSNRNYEVVDGTLKIIARKQNNSCSTLGGQFKSWTSGRLNSKDKQEFLYGRIESRIRFHNLERGTWPAFWMLENRIAEQPIKGDGDHIGWPNAGASEIDVWEWFSNEPDTYITNFFNTAGCGSEVRYHYPNGAQDVLDWHKYALEWTEDKIDFYVDETLVTSQNVSNCSRYQEPMFVLLNVAMGGNLGGTIDPSLTRATMEVDYIAHCEKSDSSSAFYCDEDAPRRDGIDTEPEYSQPEVTLRLQQGGKSVESVSQTAGKVRVSANLSILDEDKPFYSLYWQTDGISRPQYSGTYIEFDPTTMAPGNYSIGVTLRHSNSSGPVVTENVNFKISNTQTASPEAGSFGRFSIILLLICGVLRRKSTRFHKGFLNV